MLNTVARRLHSIGPGPRTQAVSFRVGASLVGNIARSALAFATGLVTARSLGPSAYGDLGFLLGSFAAVGSLLEMGTSSAFYTFLSQGRRSRSFLRYYSAWILLQFLVPALFVLALPSGAFGWIWLDHPRRLVLFAFIASFLLTQLWGVLTQLGEARRLTVLIQSVTIAQAFVHLVLIAGAAYFHWLSVEAVLLFMIGEYLLSAVYLAPRLARENVDAGAVPCTLRQAFVEFATYCRPLVVYGWFSFAHVFLDRWLLQRYGGSVQQGFFSVANQFAMIGGILTMSVGKVLWKEIAEARQSGDERRIEAMYDKVSHGLFFAVAWTCCLLIPYAAEILKWTIGAAFTGAMVAFALMLLYPIHQALGQAQATLFYATEETSTYARIGLWTMALSVPFTYFMLAPRSALLPGLALGATGLAIKMVVLNIGSVSVQAGVIARRHGWHTAFASQAGILTLLLCASWASRGIVGALARLVTIAPPPGVSAAAGIALYCATTAALAYRFPKFTGIDRLLSGSRITSVAR